MTANKLSKIRNIIFDLGAVLLNINPLLSLNEISKVSGIDHSELKSRLEKGNIFGKFDCGLINPDQFRSEMCNIMGKLVSDEEIDRIWNLLLLDFPLHRVKLIRELKKNYRIFLLSNTNSIHYHSYTNTFYREYGTKFEELFDSLFLSYEMGFHKPDAEIYKQMLNRADLNPSECLFIDDLLPNIEAASALGIETIHLTSEYDVTHYFENGTIRKDLF